MNSRTQKRLLLELLPVLAFTHNFDPNRMSTRREISAAAINVSGRQRMLSQRTALFSLRLVSSRNQVEREQLRQELLAAVDLMEQSHNGLISGDRTLKLLGNPSPEIQAMYFEPPLDLDKQIRKYICEVRTLAQVEECDLTPDNPHLDYILNAASTQLLAALDAVVSQYQKESEAEQLALDITQAELYHQSCAATAAAQAQTQRLEKALHDLKQTQAQLIHSERISSLGQLVASLAHEINNPVSFIHGNLNYANDYVQSLLHLLHLYQKQYPHPSTEIQDYIADIDIEFITQDLPQVLSSMTVGIDRIAQLVLSLRNFSRLDEAKMQPADLHAGLDSTLLILQNRLRSKGQPPAIQVIKEYGNLPLVECYAGQLNQVFMNLLSNAIDALELLESSTQFENLKTCQPFYPTIWIRTEMQTAHQVTIRIADNGSGISEDVKEQLFDPFFTTKPTGQGTGLGLSISYQIVVEQHGGTLRCESAPGQGTEFWLEIPVRQSVKTVNPSEDVALMPSTSVLMG